VEIVGESTKKGCIVSIALMEKGQSVPGGVRPGSREEAARLAELASILGGGPIRRAYDAVRVDPHGDALTRVARAICANRQRQHQLTVVATASAS
jgi:hypothetical protein